MQWLSQLRHSQYTLTGIVLGIIIAWLVLPPIWFLIQGSLFTTNADFSRSELTLEYYKRLINEPKLLTSGWNLTLGTLF
jgi:ABC-type spermidine/putrescine transport system permease subunit II